MDCFERIDNFKPDLLLLDHYIPPVKGLEVLHDLLELVSSDKIQRPKLILGISILAPQMMRWNQRGMVP